MAWSGSSSSASSISAICASRSSRSRGSSAASWRASSSARSSAQRCALAVEPRQRLERARVQRLDGQDLGVDLLGVAGAAQALLLQLGDGDQQIAAQRC